MNIQNSVFNVNLFCIVSDLDLDPDPDQLQETLIRIREANKKSL